MFRGLGRVRKRASALAEEGRMKVLVGLLWVGGGGGACSESDWNWGCSEGAAERRVRIVMGCDGRRGEVDVVVEGEVEGRVVDYKRFIGVN